MKIADRRRRGKVNLLPLFLSETNCGFFLVWILFLYGLSLPLFPRIRSFETCSAFFPISSIHLAFNWLLWIIERRIREESRRFKMSAWLGVAKTPALPSRGRLIRQRHPRWVSFFMGFKGAYRHLTEKCCNFRVWEPRRWLSPSRSYRHLSVRFANLSFIRAAGFLPPFYLSLFIDICRRDLQFPRFTPQSNHVMNILNWMLIIPSQPDLRLDSLPSVGFGFSWTRQFNLTSFKWFGSI